MDGRMIETMTDDRIERSALYQLVANRLRQRIYRRELLPGEAIDELELCRAFGISRTPLREALKVLHSEGLVELIPRRGCRVKKLELDELRDLFPVMAVLEGLCAREALQRATPADMAQLEALHAQLEILAAAGDINKYYEINFLFHQAVQQISGNRWLQRVAMDLRQNLRLSRHTQLTLAGRLHRSLAEHRQIMDAFRRRDAVAVEETMKQHLNAQLEALEREENHKDEPVLLHASP
jgi:DNA-binding GntR family transcriptional regulator